MYGEHVNAINSTGLKIKVDEEDKIYYPKATVNAADVEKPIWLLFLLKP